MNQSAEIKVTNTEQVKFKTESQGYTLYSVTELPDKKSLKNLSLGSAKIKEGDMHYTVKLNIFPNQTFYLRKNTYGESYVLYSKVQRFENGTIRMRRPVGSGELLKNLKTHLRLNFSFPKSSVFMGLYPEKSFEGV
jgi:hypothetical protein